MKRRASYSPGAPPAKKGRQQAPPPVFVIDPYSKLESKERKYNDVTVNLDCNSTSTEVALSTFATGDSVLLRDGNKVIFKSFDMKLRLTNSALTQSNVCRFALVVDTFAQAEQATWGTGSSVAEVFDAATVVARRNILSAERFVVLMDEVVTLNAYGGTGAGPTQAYVHRHIKIPQKVALVAWSGASATIPVKNAYTLMYLGSTASGATDVTVEGTVRIRWCEK